VPRAELGHERDGSVEVCLPNFGHLLDLILTIVRWGVLDLGVDAGAADGPLRIIGSRMGCLLDTLQHAYRLLGVDQATGGDEVFFQLVVARIIEPVSKLDSARVREEAGVAAVPYRTVTRRLRVFAKDSWRQQISSACAASSPP